MRGIEIMLPRATLWPESTGHCQSLDLKMALRRMPWCADFSAADLIVILRQAAHRIMHAMCHPQLVTEGSKGHQVSTADCLNRNGAFAFLCIGLLQKMQHW